MKIKNDRLRKLEAELENLERWLSLGLVPKRDLEKHQEEKKFLEEKILEEKENLRKIKESGEDDETIFSRKSNKAAPVKEFHNTLEMDINDDDFSNYGFETTAADYDISSSYDQHTENSETEEHLSSAEEEEEEDDPFSDRNRWKRGLLENTDNVDW